MSQYRPKTSARCDEHDRLPGQGENGVMPAHWTVDTTLKWFDQVLELERLGKPTTPAAHDIAAEAKRRAGTYQQEREVGSDDE